MTNPSTTSPTNPTQAIQAASQEIGDFLSGYCRYGNNQAFVANYKDWAAAASKEIERRQTAWLAQLSDEHLSLIATGQIDLAALASAK